RRSAEAVLPGPLKAAGRRVDAACAHGFPHGRRCHLLSAPLPRSRTERLHPGVTALGGHLALLERFDHRAVLDLFASERYHYWTGTAAMTDVLVRAALPRPVRAPAICMSLRVPARVWRDFRERYGVSLRSGYSRRESGPGTIDA